jgi:WD40 repeat protein
VRVANIDKIPQWLETLPQVETTWASLVQTFRGHLGIVEAVTFSPDGEHIASGSWDKTIKLWDATTGDVKKTLKGHSDVVTAVAFSPDGKHIASGSWDKTIKLWDATTGDVKETLEGHSSIVNAVAFSPDGKHIASGSWDKTVKLWRVGKTLRLSNIFENTLNSHLNYRFEREIKTIRVVTSLRYSADGRKIISNAGSLTVDDVASDAHSCSPTPLDELWVDNMWLCYGAMRLLQLASDSEPQCYDTSSDQVAVGMSSGLVLVFGIDRRRLDVDYETQLASSRTA